MYSQFNNPGDHRMVDTSSISPKPGIKRYVGNNMFSEARFDDTAEETLEIVWKLTEKDWLWTGESVYCICTHHVEKHCTFRDKYGRVITIHCHGSEERCNCELFRTYSIRIDLIEDNYYHKTVTEGLDIV
jgi:hypothetical protein